MILEKKIFYETLFREHERELIQLIKNNDKDKLDACLVTSAEYSCLTVELNDTMEERFIVHFIESDYSDREEIYDLFYNYFERLKFKTNG